MTATYPATGRRRRTLVPAAPVGPTSAESVPQVAVPLQDPPIYRALIRTWADRGRTLPGRHDPEWARLVAPSAMYGYGYGPFSASRDPRGDGR
ncbi:hypothetical protein [Streptomyces sp. SAS_270]|uniref:hypothetical protein n=1 Tax=Streptomyces sp. SAS_270 TaxID=3412748 RepID=UPI00403D445C